MSLDQATELWMNDIQRQFAQAPNGITIVAWEAVADERSKSDSAVEGDTDLNSGELKCHCALVPSA